MTSLSFNVIYSRCRRWRAIELRCKTEYKYEMNKLKIDERMYK